MNPMKMRKFMVLTAVLVTVVSCRTVGDNGGYNAVEIAVTPTEGVLKMSSLYDGYEMIVPEGVVISGIADGAVSDGMIIVL